MKPETLTLKLNLGAGATPLAGYENLDRKSGQEIYPLGYPDAVADEIRASHVLEHFPHAQVPAVLAEWARVLKPGGVLKIAVPDFAWIAQAYLDGKEAPIEGYLMGGQVDAEDFHKAVFDAGALAELLRGAGLFGITGWSSEAQDCAALPVSLNLQAVKPLPAAWKVGAAMSTPRLGFMDNFFTAFESLSPLKIGLRRVTGAFWGQCLERCLETWLAEDIDWALTLDYDSVFDRRDVESLLALAMAHPEADALCALQMHRTQPTPLMTIQGADGKNIGSFPREHFAPDLTRVHTAHFGLTLIRVAALKDLPKPWFWAKPAPDGSWGEGRVDDDISFWKLWQAEGRTLYQANHIPVGHLELMVRWPDRNLRVIHQHASEWAKEGKPGAIWR